MANETRQSGPRGHGPGMRGGYQKPKDARKTALRLLSYVTGRPALLALVLLCLLISVGTNLAGSYMLRPIINDFVYTGASDVLGLGLSLVKLLGIYLLGAAAAYVQMATMVRLSERGINRLRRELMSRFTNDADNVELALQQSLVSLLSSALMFVGIVAIMLVTNPLLFLVTLVVLVVTMLVFSQMGGKSRRNYQAQQAALGRVNGNIQEMI